MRALALLLITFTAVLLTHPSFAANAPWGTAKSVEQKYSKQKVVYDAAVSSVAQMTSILNRASYLSILNDADPFDSKIVIVMHGDEIPFFAIKNYGKYKELMDRAQSLTVGGNIEFRMCKVAAKGKGFGAKDIHGFVTLVPMADAEIIRLQQEKYAYMR